MTGPKRALILDDEASFAKLVANAVTELGFEAVVAHTGQEFRERYGAMPSPDFIFLDIVMPDEDGIEIVRWLVDKGCRSRVIIISGYNPVFSKAAELIGAKAGGMHVTRLQKPVKLATLRAVLTESPDAP